MHANRRIALVPTLFLCAALAPPPAPQHAAGATQTSSGQHDPAVVLGKTQAGQEVGLFYYRPTRLDPDDIIASVHPVHGRVTQYFDPSTGDDRDVDNLRSFGELLVLVDTLDRVDLVLSTIRGLERESATPASAEPVSTLYYQPRFTSVASLRDALAPFDHQVYRQNQWVPTIATVDDGTALIIHDNVSSMDEINELLAELDRPAPQVLLSAWVVLGGQDGDDRLPHELTTEMRRLLPYENYATVSMGLVRTAVKPGAQVRIDLAANSSYSLELRIAAFRSQERSRDVRPGRVPRARRHALRDGDDGRLGALHGPRRGRQPAAVRRAARRRDGKLVCGDDEGRAVGARSRAPAPRRRGEAERRERVARRRRATRPACRTRGPAFGFAKRAGYAKRASAS